MMPVFDPLSPMNSQGLSSPISKWLKTNVARINKRRRVAQYCFAAIEYLLFAAAAANIILTFLDLNRHSVRVWRCNTPYLSLSWILTGFFVHLVAFIGLTKLSWPAALLSQVFRRMFTTLTALVRLEFTPSLFLWEDFKQSQLWDTVVSDLTYKFASVSVVAHCVYGTIVRKGSANLYMSGHRNHQLSLDYNVNVLCKPSVSDASRWGAGTEEQLCCPSISGRSLRLCDAICHDIVDPPVWRPQVVQTVSHCSVLHRSGTQHRFHSNDFLPSDSRPIAVGPLLSRQTKIGSSHLD